MKSLLVARQAGNVNRAVRLSDCWHDVGVVVVIMVGGCLQVCAPEPVAAVQALRGHGLHQLRAAVPAVRGGDLHAAGAVLLPAVPHPHPGPHPGPHAGQGRLGQRHQPAAAHEIQTGSSATRFSAGSSRSRPLTGPLFSPAWVCMHHGWLADGASGGQHQLLLLFLGGGWVWEAERVVGGREQQLLLRHLHQRVLWRRRVPPAALHPLLPQAGREGGDHAATEDSRHGH